MLLYILTVPLILTKSVDIVGEIKFIDHDNGVPFGTLVVVIVKVPFVFALIVVGVTVKKVTVGGTSVIFTEALVTNDNPVLVVNETVNVSARVSTNKSIIGLIVNVPALLVTITKPVAEEKSALLDVVLLTV